MDDVSDEAGASLSQSFGMDKADIFFGRTLKLTLGWKIRSHRSENGKKIMGEDPQSLENHGFPQISQLVLHSTKHLEVIQDAFLLSHFLYPAVSDKKKKAPDVLRVGSFCCYAVFRVTSAPHPGLHW